MSMCVYMCVSESADPTPWGQGVTVDVSLSLKP